MSVSISRVVFVSVLVFHAVAVPQLVQAAPITVNTLRHDLNYGSGFWIGTTDVTHHPDVIPEERGNITLTVAQSFTAKRDFLGVTGAVDFLRTGAPDVETLVTFALVTGEPGNFSDPLALTDIAVTRSMGGNAHQRYLLDFGNTSLSDGTTYWLMARSTAVMQSDGTVVGGALPIWAVSPIWGGPLMWERASLLGTQTAVQNQSFAFFLEGTIIGDPIANGDETNLPEEIHGVPEPTTLFCAVIGLLGMFTVRSRIEVGT